MQLNLKAFPQQRKRQAKQKENLQIRENICKQNNQQRINLQNIKTAHAAQYQKNKQLSQKIRGRSTKKQTLLQRRHLDGQQTHKKILSISNYQRNTNQNYNKVSPHIVENGYHQISTNNKFWRGCGGKRTLLHFWWECKLIHSLWRNVQRFLKKQKQNYEMTHSWRYTQRKP